jgi:hypothetical protein
MPRHADRCYAPTRARSILRLTIAKRFRQRLKLVKDCGLSLDHPPDLHRLDRTSLRLAHLFNHLIGESEHGHRDIDAQ